MCGIVGGNLFTSEEQMKRSLSLISHRGKDNSSFINYNGFWMGHNRLSIQDVSNKANQPFEKHGISIVFNGELWKKTFTDYYEVLKSRYSFITNHSDTELLLYMYKEYGEEIFSHLDGMFSFALLNNNHSTVYLVRDFMGRLPFYYYIENGKIAFASELKVLTTIFNLTPDEIKIVEPGTYIAYDIWNGKFRYEVYHVLNNEVNENLDENEICLTLRKSLELAVDNELISDVPVCTILSGGIDSTIITYLLSKKVKNLEAFVVSVGDNPRKKDDLYYARIAAKWLNIPLHEVIVDEKYIMKHISDAIWAVEDYHWTQVSPAIPQLALSKAISDKGYKVVFGGEGADELFGSYGHVLRWYYEDDAFKKIRYKLVTELHKNNLIRTNKAMMFGGTVELRTPFLDKEFVKYCLKIPPKFKFGNKRLTKPLLRKAFEKEIPDELRLRTKKTFQEGCHTDFLKSDKDKMKLIYDDFFGTKNLNTLEVYYENKK